MLEISNSGERTWLFTWTRNPWGMPLYTAVCFAPEHEPLDVNMFFDLLACQWDNIQSYNPDFEED